MIRVPDQALRRRSKGGAAVNSTAVPGVTGETGMRIQTLAAAAAGLALAALATSAVTQPAAPPAKPAPSTKVAPKCFRSHDWQGWRPTPDSKSMYIHVGVNDYYRVDFTDS